MRRVLGCVVAAAAFAWLASPAVSQTAAPADLGQAASSAVTPGRYTGYPAVDSRFQSDLQTRPRSPGVRYRKAVEAMQAKHYRVAAHLLGDLTDQKPADVEFWRLLGAAYGGEGRWHAAQRAYERALRLAPDDILSHAGRAEALVARNDPSATEERAWLTARSQACAGSCADAAVLRTLESRGPFGHTAS
jgi:predicted Zn-dependent protease